MKLGQRLPSPPTLRPHVLAPVLALALLLLYAVMPHGPSVTSDAANYLSAAESLASEGRLLTVSGLPFSTWPPLLPTVLSAAPLVGVRATALALTLNVAAAAATLIMLSVLVTRASGSPVIGGLAATGVAVSWPFLRATASVWSEPLYVTCSVGLVLLCWLLWERPSTGTVVAIAVVAGAAALTRYIGVVNIGLGFVAVYAVRRRLRPGPWWLLALYASVAAAPFGIWVARNLVVTGTPAGPRIAPDHSAVATMHETVATLGNWFTPAVLPGRADGFVLVALAVIWAASLWYGSPRASVLHRAELGALAFLCAYVAVLVASTITTAFERLNDRLLLPALPVLVLVMACALARLRVPRPIVVAALVTFVAVQIPTTLTFVRAWNTNGPYRVTEVAAAVPRDTLGRLVDDAEFTDASGAVYLTLGERVMVAPDTRGGAQWSRRAQFRSLLAAQGDVDILWFGPGDLWLWRPELLAAEFDVTATRYGAAELVSVRPRGGAAGQPAGAETILANTTSASTPAGGSRWWSSSSR